jgi:4a-hydroxytetrahydrobiopterin dehydratase
VATLSPEELADGLAGLDGWEDAGGEIAREFRFPGFPDAVAFVTRVAFAAEAANHHPDLDIRYNRVRVSLSTHDAGGVTAKDLDLAREIQSLAAPAA